MLSQQKYGIVINTTANKGSPDSKPASFMDLLGILQSGKTETWLLKKEGWYFLRPQQQL